MLGRLFFSKVCGCLFVVLIFCNVLFPKCLFVVLYFFFFVYISVLLCYNWVFRVLFS